MSHYGPKWQVISNLSLTPVWTRIWEPSMKADTPIFEFVICNWGEGGETVYYGLQQVMRDFSTDHGYIFVHQMDNYESRKFVKNREKKFLIIDLWSHIYRVGIKFSRFLIFTREKYIYIYFQMKIRFIARTIIAILNLSRMSISWLPSPLSSPRSARTLKQPRAHDLVDKEDAGRRDRKCGTSTNQGVVGTQERERGWSEKDP